MPLGMSGAHAEARLGANLNTFLIVLVQKKAKKM